MINWILGGDSIAADLKDRKLTVVGEIDTVAVVKKMMKVGKIHSQLLTILAILCEICPLIWYILSYIPFARTVVSKLTICLFDIDVHLVTDLEQRFKSFTVKMETYHWKRSKRARQFLLERNYEVSEEEHVELGSIYEIDHKNLPPRTPVQLRSMRVVMVSEKRDLNVAIRYPSILSLRTYFSHGITEVYPALDEKFAMGIKLAGKVLFREVPSQELAEKKHLQDFWLVNPNTQDGSGHAVLD
ncbi:hypothetical protein L1887_02380 [Cichorium endivia]|nr:hypothetical protein L1887_02380 [Cichorium endivia]